MVSCIRFLEMSCIFRYLEARNASLFLTVDGHTLILKQAVLVEPSGISLYIPSVIYTWLIVGSSFHTNSQ